MTTYNGYKNWNTWNVSLWVNIEEWFYNYALELVKRYGDSADGRGFCFCFDASKVEGE